MTSDAVRAAAALPDLNHRDPDYQAVHADVRSALRRLGGGFTPYVIGGSGTAAMEAAVTSCVSEGPCLIVSNGYYAERYERIFEAHEIECETVWFPWSSPWDLAQIEEQLEDGGFEAVLMTHHETSSGRLNPVPAVARLAAKYEATVIVDAVSSLGAEFLDPDGVHAVFSSANKCLHGLPGVAFVLLEPSFAREIESYPQRSYYLHLPLYAGDRPPLTPPVPAMRAFRQALVEFEDVGGVPARHERYTRQAARIRAFLRSIGCGTYVPDDQASCAVTVATIPSGFVADTWLRANYDAGFVLFECKGEMRETHFQVSTMGEVSDENVEGWVAVASRLIESGR
jgi:2-aminoethylphosphonate-pyruvate transaminase